MRFSRTRRSTVAAIAALPFFVRGSFAASLQCGKDLVLAVIAPLSGPLAMTGLAYVDGVREARDSAARNGCESSLSVIDASDPARQLEAVLSAVTGSKARVVIGAFGYSIANLAANRAPEALLIDLQQSSSSDRRPENLVALPYADLFFTTSSEGRGASLKMAGSVAATIVFETVRTAKPSSLGSAKDIVAAMSARTYKTEAGAIALDPSTGTFRRKL